MSALGAWTGGGVSSAGEGLTLFLAFVDVILEECLGSELEIEPSLSESEDDSEDEETAKSQILLWSISNRAMILYPQS